MMVTPRNTASSLTSSSLLPAAGILLLALIPTPVLSNYIGNGLNTRSGPLVGELSRRQEGFVDFTGWPSCAASLCIPYPDRSILPYCPQKSDTAGIPSDCYCLHPNPLKCAWEVSWPCWYEIEAWFTEACPTVPNVSFDSAPSCAAQCLKDLNKEEGCKVPTHNCFCTYSRTKWDECTASCREEENVEFDLWYGKTCLSQLSLESNNNNGDNGDNGDNDQPSETDTDADSFASTSPEPSESESESESESRNTSSTNVPLIAGAAAGGFVVAVLFVLFLWWFRRRRNRNAIAAVTAAAAAVPAAHTQQQGYYGASTQGPEMYAYNQQSNMHHHHHHQHQHQQQQQQQHQGMYDTAAAATGVGAAPPYPGDQKVKEIKKEEVVAAVEMDAGETEVRKG